MGCTTEVWKEWIFELMTDAVNIEQYPVEESRYIENIFAEGSVCDNTYQEVYDAKCRLCQRLGVQEDEDVERIIIDLLTIGKYMSMRMFDYGVLFASYLTTEKEA